MKLKKLKVNQFQVCSFLADNNVNTKVEGLNDFPKMNTSINVHYFFDLMVTMGVLCFVISEAFILTLMIKNCVNTLRIKVCYMLFFSGPAAMCLVNLDGFN